MEKDVTFRYDAEKETWVECRVPEWNRDETDGLPVILVAYYCDERTGEKGTRVWCEAHRAYEKIGHWTEDGLITGNGCRLKGLLLRSNVYPMSSLWFHDAGEGGDVIRWRMKYRPEEGNVYLCKDTAHIGFNWEKKEDGSFLLVPIFRSVSQDNVTLSLQEGEPHRLCDMPGPFVDAVLEALREEAARLYGGLLPLHRPGGSITAFLRHPFDRSIEFFRPCFRKEDDKFDCLFPRTQADNFSTLCGAFGVEPTETLKTAYWDNPTFFLLRLLLPELGIRQEALIQEFHGLSVFFDGVTVDYGVELLSRAQSLDVSKEKESGLADLRFYCAWRREKESEESLALQLLKEQHSWRAWKSGMLRLFHRYFDEVHRSLREEIMEKGLTISACDEMKMIAHRHSMSHPDKIFSEKERKLECCINGFNFRLIPSYYLFKNLFGIVVFGRYILRDDFMDKHSICLGIERNGKWLGAIHIENGKARREFHHFHERSGIYDAKRRIAYLRWIRHNNLEEHYPSKDDVLPAMSQEFAIGPAEKDAEWENMGLRELLDLPESSVRSGYYLHLCRKFAEVRPLSPYPPAAEDDERAYLTERYSLGKRIYDAAWAGNPEAQYVMSVFYSEHFAFGPVRRLAWSWYSKACENGWLETEAAKADIRLEGFSGAAEDHYNDDRGGFLVG